MNELLRLRGGGGDGGVYPLTHAEMKWMTPSEMGTTGGGCQSNATKDKASEETLRLERATVCAASSKPLRSPIVVCELGHLLNKEDAIEYLLSKKMPAHLSHIKSLKGLHDATLHANPEHKGITSDAEPPFYCPIAMLPMNGRYPFVFIRQTGHVVSARALKQVGGKLCPISEVALNGADVTIPINPPEEERKVLADRIAAKKDAKKDRSSKAKATEAPRETELPAGGKRPVPHPTSSGGGGNSCGKASTAESATGSAPELRGKLPAAPAAVAAGPSASRAQPLAADRKRPHREWEERIEQRASESSVYKSLFLSADERRRQEKEEAANFCARGIVPSLSRSTKFGIG